MVTLIDYVCSEAFDRRTQRVVPFMSSSLDGVYTFETHALLDACNAVMREYTSHSPTHQICDVYCTETHASDVQAWRDTNVIPAPVHIQVLMPKEVVEAFEERVALTGYWWFLLRINEQHEAVYFTLSPSGDVMHRAMVPVHCVEFAFPAEKHIC